MTDMVMALIVIMGICVLGYIYFNQKAKADALIDEGKMIKRNMMFWKKIEFFTTSSDYEAVKKAAHEMDLSGTNAYISEDEELDGKGVILFKSKSRWNAAIMYKGEKEDGKYLYRFSFTTWESENGFPKDENSMNVMMTGVEKMFVTLDPDTTVETEQMNVKSKTKFF